MKIVLLDTGTMGNDIDFSSLDTLGECVKYHNTQPDEVPERIKDADAVIINKVLLNESVLQYAKNLKLICVFAIGYNNIDIEYCKKRGIKVRNVPGYCVESVCQHTFAILFALLEKLRYYDDFVKNGEYTKSGLANHLGKPFFEISGKKWGIIGMGAIGRAVADCAAAFGAEVCYSSISGAIREEKYENVPFDTLLRESDIISVHAPLNEKTINLIGGEELKKMKKTAYIVNVGRGAIIDEAALAVAINNGEIAGAALDVYTEEPPVADSPILSIKDSERIVYTPHIAWASVEARQRCVDMTAENVKAFIEGKSLNDVWE
ncbi:MAG: D-2-hydroxyacid dehydrogenase [Clostridia bacterium]|nr:D-2-hydroxyacid dehydrogenase [Clostridia bacterium]